VATILVATGQASYRRLDGAPTPTWVVRLLRAGFVSIGVLFGMTAWVAAHAPFELALLFALFPTTVAAIEAMITAGRRDMFASVLIPMTVLAATTLSISPDIRLRWTPRPWRTSPRTSRGRFALRS
jgi:hypothetical protein